LGTGAGKKWALQKMTHGLLSTLTHWSTLIIEAPLAIRALHRPTPARGRLRHSQKGH